MFIRRLANHPRPRRRMTVIAAVAAMTAAAGGTISATSAVADTTPQPQTLTWGPCTAAPGTTAPGGECATLTVPQDWQHPSDGPTLSIAVSRVRAADPTHRKGVLFTNPGGPGGEGLGLPDRLAQAQPELAKSYDLVGMDPRGVGASTNLTCQMSFAANLNFLRYDIRDDSPAAKTARADYSKAIADGCAKNPLTRYINTWQTVHDMDALRAAMGERKLNYLGFSYGTWLGAKYAALFPQRTGKVVLDSNTVWTGDLADAWEAMPAAMQRRMDKQLVPWLTRSPVFSKYVGTTAKQVRETYEASRAGYSALVVYPGLTVALDNSIVQSLYKDDTFIGAGALMSIATCFIGADSSDESLTKVFGCIDELSQKLYDEINGGAAEVTQMRSVAKAALTKDLATLDRVLGDTMIRLPVLAADPNEPTVDIPGTYFAVRCGDGGDWHTPAWWDRQRDRITPQNWLAGYLLAGTEVCAYWSQPAQRLPNPDPRRIAPIIAVQSEFDPATAYENVTRDLKDFRNGRLIAVDDAGIHGVYGVRGNGCVDRLVNDWLLRDVLPARTTVCGTYPLPLESVVYPVDGPVDHLRPHQSGPRHRYPRSLQDDLDRMIGSTR